MTLATDRMPMGVRVAVGAWLLVAAVPLAALLQEWAWPWADIGEHAVVHLDSECASEVVLRVAPQRGLVHHRDSWLRQPYELIYPLYGNQQVQCRVEFPGQPGWPPVETAVSVAPGDHVRVVVGSSGGVSLASGRESWLGYAVFDSPPVAVAAP